MSVTDYAMLGWVGPMYVIPNIPPNTQIDLIPNAVFNLGSTGGISYNNMNGVITLSSGKVYRLTARLTGKFMQNNGFAMVYAWVDANNNVLTPNSEASVNSHSGASIGTQPSVNDIVYSTNNNSTFVKLRALSSDGTCTLVPCRCSVVIVEIK